MESNEILRRTVAIARDAGDLLLDYAARGFAVDRKGETDLVTEADRASEDLVLSRLRSEFPGTNILAEESGLSGEPEGDLWVVDPLDGTTNFAHGIPVWSVSIGMLRNGRPEIGVVLDPNRGECFAARRGGGAYCNDAPLAISTREQLLESVLVTGFPYDLRTSPVNNLDHWEHLMKECRAVRRLGSAAIDLAWTAAGRFDAFWELKLHSWDVAAGALLVEEAGGAVTRFDGAPFDVLAPEEMVAGSPALLPKLREVLARGLRPA